MKTKKYSVKENYLYNMIYSIIIIIIPIITTPYISRVLYADGIGAYQYTFAIVNFFVLFANLGISMYAQRELAYNDGDVKEQSKIVFSVFIIRLITTFIVTVFYIFLLLFAGKYRILLMIQYIWILANCLNISWLFQAKEDFKKTATRGVLVKVLTLIAIFIFVKNESDVYIYTFINAFSSLIGSIILWFYLKGNIVRVNLRFNDIKKHIKPIVILFIPVAAIYVYTYVDRIFLGLLANDIEVGYYSLSENIVKVSLTIITSLSAVLLSKITKLIKTNRKDLVKKYIIESIKFVIIIGLPMVLGLIALSNLFVPWFFGKGYIPCILLIKILSPLIIIIGLASVVGQTILISINKKKEYTISIIIGAISNVIINIVLIPNIGAVGASIGTIIAESIVTLIQLVITFKIFEINIISIIKNNIKVVISGFGMFIVLVSINHFFKSTIIDTFIYMLIGIFIYFVILLLLKEEFIIKNIKNFKNNIIKKIK